jgi:ATP-dependent protease ClpP protease subunit
MEKMNKNYLVERVSVESTLVNQNLMSAEFVEIQAAGMSSNSEYKNRVLNLFGDFDRNTISEMMKKCLKWEEEDAEILYKHSQQIRQLQDPRQLLKPIILNINSPGGHVDELLALVDMLESMPAPVVTRAYGQVCSCGFVLFCVGDERYVGNNASLMYHELGYGIWGKDSEVKNYHEYTTKIQKRIDKIIKNKTGITLKKLKEWRKENQDKWLDAEEAVELGIATDLLY